MQNLKEAYIVLQTKKKERAELVKMFKDELKHNGDYQKILEDIKVLQERKKSIENAAKAGALSDARQLDDLTEDIKSQKALLSDIATTMLANGEKIEIVDEVADVRLTPQFAVDFKKDDSKPEEQGG